MADSVQGTLKLSNDRTQLIDRIITTMEKRIGSAQKELVRMLASEFVDKLDRDGDTIKNTLRNKRLVSLVDTIYERFASSGRGLDLTNGVVDGMDKVIGFNKKYYSPFRSPAKMKPIDMNVVQSMGDWLGLTEQGKAEKNGYLDTLVKDPQTIQTIKDMSMAAIVGQQGYFETKNALKDYIDDTPKSTGRLRQYYRNFVYDKFSQADRTAAKVYADNLRLNYAIYEGGLIKTSRQFCKDRNGKVFSRAEIEAFDPTEARPPGYNPFTDLGGYGCRHHLNWVPDAVAFAMRPELRNKEPEELPPSPEPTVVGKEAPERPAANTPYAELKPFKAAPIKFTPQDRNTLQKFGALESEIRSQRTARQQGQDRYQVLANRLQAPGLSEADRAAIIRELDEVTAKFIAASKKIQEAAAQQKALNDQFRDRMLRPLARSTVKITNTSSTLSKSKAFRENLKSGEDFFRAAARGYMEELGISIKALRGQRAYASGENIFVGTKTPSAVIVHELAHQLERHNFVFKSAVDFLERRTAGNPIQRLKSLNRAYGNGEVYRDGGFFDPYIGKIYTASATSRSYNGYRATEVISMGLQRMYEDPLGFYRSDPDHFNFIYSLFFAR